MDGNVNVIEISNVPGSSDGTLVEYGISVVLANKHSTASTLNILTSNPSFKRAPDETKKIVRSKFTQSSDITCDTNSITMMLTCPVSGRWTVSSARLLISFYRFQNSASSYLASAQAASI